MHGTTMIFLGVMPLSAMFFNYMIPLQIGARDVAFPRLNAFSYWVFLLGGLILNASWLFGAAPNGGWFGYANLTTKQFSPGPQHRFLDGGPADPGHRLAGGGGQLLRDDHQSPRAGHEDDAHAHVRAG